MSQPTNDQLREVEQSGGLKWLSYTADGVSVQERPATSIENEVAGRVESQLSETLDSLARRRQQKRRAHVGEFIQPIHLGLGDEVEEWFIKKLSDNALIEIGVRMGLDGYTLREITTLDAQLAFYQALVGVGTCRGEADVSPFFETTGEVKAYFDDPAMAPVCLVLRATLLRLNAEFFPEEVKKNLPSATNELM